MVVVVVIVVVHHDVGLLTNVAAARSDRQDFCSLGCDSNGILFRGRALGWLAGMTAARCYSEHLRGLEGCCARVVVSRRCSAAATACSSGTAGCCCGKENVRGGGGRHTRDTCGCGVFTAALTCGRSDTIGCLTWSLALPASVSGPGAGDLGAALRVVW